LRPDYFAGFPGVYMTARENIKSMDGDKEKEKKPMNKHHHEDFHMTILGPKGLKDRLIKAFGFLGRMIYLRPIEFTLQDALREEQKYGVSRYVVDEIFQMKDQIKYLYPSKFFDQPKKVLFQVNDAPSNPSAQAQNPNTSHNLMFKDNNVTVYPIEVTNDKGEKCYSYICQPRLGKRTFLPEKAK